ncbi:MAG: hypothetical protein ACRDB0_04810 [Paraclostridium sp.]
MLEILIEEILQELEIPFECESYEGNENTYIMYSNRFTEFTDAVDDKASKEDSFVIVHYWTNERHKVKAWRDIQKAFEEKGFELRRVKTSKDKEFTGKLLEFNYIQEV